MLARIRVTAWNAPRQAVPNTIVIAVTNYVFLQLDRNDTEPSLLRAYPKSRYHPYRVLTYRLTDTTEAQWAHFSSTTSRNTVHMSTLQDG